MFFWKEWDKQSKAIYLTCIVLLGFSLLFSGFYYFVGNSSFIAWEILSTIEKVRIPIDSFSRSVFEFSVEADAHLVFQQYIGSDVRLSLNASLLYFLITSIALLIVLTTLSFLNNWLYYFGTSVVLLSFVAQQPNLLFNELSWIKYIQVLPIVALGGLSYYFFAFKSSFGFAFRLICFAALVFAYYSFIITQSGTALPLLHLTNYGLLVLIVMSILFIFFIAYEIVYGFLYIISANKNSAGHQGTLHFSIITGLYLLNLILQYFKNTRIVDLEIFHISPFFILACSIILGIWGFKERSVMFSKLLPFYPFGAVIYICWATICVGTIGYLFATANDSLVEVFEDFILFTHIGFGIAFFMYVMGSYSKWMNTSVAVSKVVYSYRWVSFIFVYSTGALLVFAMLSYSNLFTWYQSQAGYYNGLGDIYYAQNSISLAQEYYQKAASYEFQNHKSNYSLATIQKNLGRNKEAINFYKKATLKQPSEYAYANLSQLYVSDDKALEAVFYLKEGLHQFPNSTFLKNNLGVVYKQLNFLDSAIIYFTIAERTEKKPIAGSNKLACFTKNKIIAEVTSTQTDLIYQSNLMAYNAANAIKQISLPPIDQTDTILTDVKIAFLANRTLLSATQVDTTQTKYFEKVIPLDTNIYYRNELTFLRAIHSYYSGEISKAMHALDDMQLGDEYEAGYYLNTLGLWNLQNGQSKFASEVFQMAYDKGSKTSLIHKAISLLESGYEEEAIRILNLDEIKKNPQNQNLLEQINTLYSVKNFNSLIVADDATKYLVLHFRIKSMNDDQLGNLFFSYKSRDYQLKSGIELFDYFYKQEKYELCDEVLNQLRDTNHVEKNIRMLVMQSAKKDWVNLTRSLKENRLEKDNNGYWNYFTAKIKASNGQEASKEYLKAAKELAFNEQIVMEVAEYLSSVAKNNSDSYQVLLEGISLCPYSTVLLKKYCLQSINLGIPSFAESGLIKLKGLISDQEYKQFEKEFNIHKQEFLNSL